MIKKEAGRLDWSRSNIDLDRQIRAMTPWPGAYTYWEGDLLKVLAAHPLDRGMERHAPGHVFEHEGQIAAQTGAGALVLDRLQLAGKKALPATAFAHGRSDFLTATLGD
jgi:methionyl-tRNA formyltransferase